MQNGILRNRVPSFRGPLEYLNWFLGIQEFPFCGRRGIDSSRSCAPRPPRASLRLHPFHPRILLLPIHVQCARHYAVHTYIRARVTLVASRVHTDSSTVCTCVRTSHTRHMCTFCQFVKRKIKCVSLSLLDCFRRSELLGCMTLPLPLSQDKVTIT